MADYTLKEAAAILDTTEPYLRRLLNEGKLPGKQIQKGEAISMGYFARSNRAV